MSKVARGWRGEGNQVLKLKKKLWVQGLVRVSGSCARYTQSRELKVTKKTYELECQKIHTK